MLQKLVILFEEKNKIMKRDKAIKTIKDFPQEFELDDLLEKLISAEKVDDNRIN